MKEYPLFENECTQLYCSKEIKLKGILQLLLKNSPARLSAIAFLKRGLLVLMITFFFANNTLADYTIPSGTSVNASTITGQSGVLTINGTLYVDKSSVSLLGFTSVIINGRNGQIYWEGNYSLYFSDGISFIINNPALGLQPTAGNGNGATRLYIGSVIIAVSSDNSNNAPFSFEDFNGAGGLPQFTLSTPASTICYSPTFTATITPLNTNVNYDCSWSINSGTITPSQVSNFNTPQIATITPTNSSSSKTYTISCTLYRTGDGNSITTKTINVIVNPVPASPTAVTTSPSSVCSGSISNLKATSAGNTIQWYTVSSGGTSIGSSTSGNNYAVSPALTTTYYAEALNTYGCTSAGRNSVSVTVIPGPVTGSISGATSVCTGTNSTVLTLNGNSGTIQWQTSTDNISFSNIGDATSSTYTASNLATNTYYRVAVTNSCSTAYSASANIYIHNIWTGATGNDWNTAANWSDNELPSNSCLVVYIPATTNQPILSGLPAATISNLNIASGAGLTVNGAGILQIAGTITNNGIFDVSNGTLVLNGTAPQIIAGSMFKNSTLKNLTLSNTVSVSNTLNDTLNILGTLSFGTGNAQLNTGNNITLKSSYTATANIGMLASGNIITGNVTVERYIASGTLHPKSWQLLAVPTSGQTINQSWQEESLAPNDNLHPGYGTQITGTGSGFDATSASPSMKIYNYATNSYTGVSGTGIQIYNPHGYLIFVRGDRSVISAFAPATPTILRTTGTLFTPANAPTGVTVHANSFESVGNPYASPLDLRTLRSLETGGVDEFFYVWDPLLGGSNGYGAYQYFYMFNGDYYVSPGGGSYGSSAVPNNYIQSGQAFMVHGSSDGAVNFNESVKAGGSSVLVTTANSVPQMQSALRTDLNVVNADGSTNLLDGVLLNFGDSYSNALDALDARKSLNSGENLSVKVAGTLLSIERQQPLTAQDTIFFNLTGVSVQQYQFQFDATNITSGLQAFLVDNYLGTRTPLSLSGITTFNFNVVNVPGSYAANRFMVVFSPALALPVTFTSVKAYQQGSNINVDWNVDNEWNIKNYELEKSTDASQFTTLALKVPASNNGGSASYEVVDTYPSEGYNYYRIKSIDLNGVIAYTGIVKVSIGNAKDDISIYPNPVTDGMLHLQLVNQPEGTFGVRLLNPLGQVILSRQVDHSSGSGTELLPWNNNLAHGIYQLEVTSPDGSIKDIKVMY